MAVIFISGAEIWLISRSIIILYLYYESECATCAVLIIIITRFDKMSMWRRE